MEWNHRLPLCKLMSAKDENVIRDYVAINYIYVSNYKILEKYATKRWGHPLSYVIFTELLAKVLL